MNSMEQKFQQFQEKRPPLQQFQAQRPPLPRSHVALWIRLTAALTLLLVGFLLYRLPGGFPPPSWVRLVSLMSGTLAASVPALIITALQALALLAGWGLLLVAALHVVSLWRFDPRKVLSQPPGFPAHTARVEEGRISTAYQAAAPSSEGREGHEPGEQILAGTHHPSLAAAQSGESRETRVLPRVGSQGLDQPTLLSFLSASSLGTPGGPSRLLLDRSPVTTPRLSEGAGEGMRLGVSTACQHTSADVNQTLRGSALFSATGFYPKPTPKPGSASQLPLGLFLLSDGFAFRQAGGPTSTDQIAVQSGALALLPRLFDNPSSAEAEAVGRRVLDAISHTNATLYRRLAQAQGDEEAEKLTVGTTLTALLILGTTAFVASVGNSRVYLFRASEGLVQVTYDQAPPPVEEARPRQDQEGGQEGEQHARSVPGTSPARNTRLYRSLGEQEQVDPDLFALRLEAGDLLLLCSDAIWSRVERVTIEETLRHASELTVADPHDACSLLCERALSGGGSPPFSLIVVQVIAITAQTSQREDASEIRTTSQGIGVGGGQ